MQVVHAVDSWLRMFVTSVSEEWMVPISLAIRTEAQREGKLVCEGRGIEAGNTGGGVACGGGG